MTNLRPLRAPEITLTEPSPLLSEAFLDLVSEHRQAAEPYLSELQTVGYSNVLDFIRSTQLQADDKALKPGYVPMSTFWALAEDRVVGVAKLRHALTDTLLEEGGHIGFYVRPSARKQGFAAAILSLVLQRARQRGLTKVLITCDASNAGSRSVIERNSAILENEIVSGVSGALIRRYWISL